MSHLSILPTVLRDETLLASALEELQLPVVAGGCLHGFGDEQEPVILQTQLPGGLWIGWRRQADGSLALVGDLQRLGQTQSPQQLIGRITRYSAPGGPGTRVDGAMYTGYTIPPYFDSMCAKLTVWNLNWEATIARGSRARPG